MGGGRVRGRGGVGAPGGVFVEEVSEGRGGGGARAGGGRGGVRRVRRVRRVRGSGRGRGLALRGMRWEGKRRKGFIAGERVGGVGLVGAV